MIKFENTEVVGWEAAIRGMRNPMNSWDKSDSRLCNMDSYCYCGKYCFACEGGLYDGEFHIGPNDHDLMMKLAAGGPVHAKYRRMIVVYVDITAPLYWWKEFDTYKVGTVANSCSTMHKIHAKEFTWEDFSCEHLIDFHGYDIQFMDCCKLQMESTIQILNNIRALYLYFDDLDYTGEKEMYSDVKELNPGLTKKDVWWQMIQLLPSSYNQRRTVMMNYEVLAGIYPMRKDHKLDEWHDFCHWIEGLPYSEIIIGEKVME